MSTSGRIPLTSRYHGTMIDEPYSPLPVTEAAATPSEAKRLAVSRDGYKAFHWLLLAYLFLYCSRITELVPSVRLSVVLSVVLIAGLLITGAAMRIFRLPAGKALAALTVWVAICVPTSVWPGGSFQQFRTTLQALLLIAYMGAFIRSIRDVRNAMYSIGLGMGAVAVLSFLITSRLPNVGGEGRMGLGESASLQDPNFYSLYLLVGLPFLFMAVSLEKGYKRILALLLMLPIMAGLARTGSRMGLLVFVASLVFFLIRATSRQRIVVSVVLALAFFIGVPLLPGNVIKRVTTFLTPGSDQISVQTEAAESAQNRLDLLWRSIVMSAEHPFLGVGPGQFMEAENAKAVAEGRPRGYWLVTHNVYTQLSSETGVIGLVLYVIALFYAYRGLGAIRKRGPNLRVRAMALYIQIALFAVILGGFFLSIGYGGLPWILIALSSIFQVAVAREMRAQRTQPAYVHAAV